MSPVTVSPLKLEVNHVETFGMDWGATFEEVLGSGGRGSFRVRDFTFLWDPQPHWDIKVTIRSNDWVLFRGKIIKPKLSLPVGQPFNLWSFECVDYFDEFSQRKVGALDGVLWTDEDGTGNPVNEDPFAIAIGDDASSVIALLDHYIRVDGQAFDTSEFVNSHVAIDPPLKWDYSDLMAALEDIASECPNNLQFWPDPDLKFHWQAIPAWQDLAQQIFAPGGLPLMMPAPSASLSSGGQAPKGISDVPVANETIGCRDLEIEYDGSNMPEQVYVKGGTGYVYNNGATPFGSEEASTAPAPTFPGQYEITFNASTLVYSRNAQGYIQLPGVAFNPGSSVTIYGNPQVIPKDPVHLTGGSFYNMKTGPFAGYLVSFWTNSLGYGDITVVTAGSNLCEPPETPPAPVLGIGGSGWTNEETQDPNKRQAYFDAPISVTRAQRDAIGGQQLYRGSRPTLRGSLTVGGYAQDPAFPDDPEKRILAEGDDGWRPGQLMHLTDGRLVPNLNDRWYVIQRVATSLVSTTDVREYGLGFGDGPVSRYSARKREKPPTPLPTYGVLVTEEDVSPAPNTTQTITGQLINRAGLPWPIAGKVVNWQLQVLDINGNVCDQGTLDPQTSITDASGKARTKLTTGSKKGLSYFVFATVPVT